MVNDNKEKVNIINEYDALFVTKMYSKYIEQSNGHAGFRIECRYIGEICVGIAARWYFIKKNIVNNDSEVWLHKETEFDVHDEYVTDWTPYWKEEYEDK